MRCAKWLTDMEKKFFEEYEKLEELVHQFVSYITSGTGMHLISQYGKTAIAFKSENSVDEINGLINEIEKEMAVIDFIKKTVEENMEKDRLTSTDGVDYDYVPDDFGDDVYRKAGHEDYFDQELYEKYVKQMDEENR